MLTIVMVTLSI